MSLYKELKVNKDDINWKVLWSYINNLDNPTARKAHNKRIISPSKCYQLRYTLDGEINMSLENVSKHFSASRSAVMQCLNRHIKVLKSPSREMVWNKNYK